MKALRDSLHSGVALNLYSGTSLIRNRLLLGPYSSPVPKGLAWSQGGARFLMSEVFLYPKWPVGSYVLP